MCIRLIFRFQYYFTDKRQLYSFKLNFHILLLKVIVALPVLKYISLRFEGGRTIFHSLGDLLHIFLSVKEIRVDMCPVLPKQPLNRLKFNEITPGPVSGDPLDIQIDLMLKQ